MVNEGKLEFQRNSVNHLRKCRSNSSKDDTLDAVEILDVVGVVLSC